jgi:hypothetical protein
MRKSEPDSDKNSAFQSARDVLSRGLLRELSVGRIKREIDGETPYPECTIATIEANIKEFQSSCDAGLPFDDLMAFMNGETGTLNSLYHEDDLFQGKKIDAQALWTLYGAMLHVGEEPKDAARYAYIYYYHSCEQDEETRRFTSYPEAYRTNQLRDAINAFDKGDWNRWFRRRHIEFDEGDYDNWTGDYSDITYDTIRALVYITCTDFDPEYVIRDLFELDYDPSSEHIQNLANGVFDEYTRRKESFHKIGRGVNPSPYRGSARYRYTPKEAIVNVAMEIDGRSKSTYDNAIGQLHKNGVLKWAEIVCGVDYRLYPTTIEDPPEANRIKFQGEEYVPESEPELMTDGGQPISEESREQTERKSEQAQSDSREQTIESFSEGQNRPRANSESNEGDGDDSVGKPPPMTPHM